MQMRFLCRCLSVSGEETEYGLKHSVIDLHAVLQGNTAFFYHVGIDIEEFHLNQSVSTLHTDSHSSSIQIQFL